MGARGARTTSAPPPPENDLRDCKCDRIVTTYSIDHPLWVVVVVVLVVVVVVVCKFALPKYGNCLH